VLCNGTTAQDVESLRSQVASWQKVIIVGGSDFGTGWPVLPRPIKLTSILSLLDDVAHFKNNEMSQSAPVLPRTVIVNPSMTDVFASITSQADTVAPQKSEPATIKPKSIKVFDTLDTVKPAPVTLNKAFSFTPLNTKLEPIKQTSATVGRVLLVDDSDIALKYMQNRLRHFSYECELVHSGEEALAMVATHSYQFVFLDVMMAGLDGYQTCKAIKNNKARQGPAPVVVMLTSRGGTIDKIRGSMAGCDAYLTKPLNDKKLGVVLAKFDESTLAQRWEAANPRQPLSDKHALRNRLA
jgi:CheY-like chemotaxis protein